MLRVLLNGLLCCLLLCTLSTFGQNDPITRVTVNQVRIDAVVTDSNGTLVRSLQSDDFQVLQDGKRQKPVHVQFVSGTEGVTPVRPNRDLVAVLRTMQSSSYLNPFLSDPAAVRRTLDRMHYLPPPFRGSFVSVFPLLRSVLAALNRMPGRKTLILFSGRMRVPTDSPVDPFQIYRQLADDALRASVKIYGIDSRGLTTQFLDPINSGVMTTGASPPSTSAHPHRGQSSRQEKNDVAETHLNQQIEDALSPVDANFPPRRAAFPQSERPLAERPPAVNDLDGLNVLANETGGLMLENSNDLESKLRKALDDQAGYYLLAWNPGEKAFEPTKGTFADFHNITVKLTHPGLTVRTPRGFYGRDTGVQNHDRSPRIAMQEALLSPFQSGRFHAQMTSGFELKDGRGYIRSFVYVDGKDILYTPVSDSEWKDCHAIRLEFLTLPQPIDSRVEALAESQITSLKMCGTSYEEIAHQGLAVTMLHPVDKPGGYLMRMAVRNVREAGDMAVASLPNGNSRLVVREEGDQPVGSAHQLVEVPEWWRAPSVFGLRVQSEKPPDSVVRPRMAGETDRNMTLSYRPAVGEGPAIRRFQIGEKLQYDARVVNVIGVAAEIRITRADSDLLVYAGEAENVNDGVVKGSYPIDSSLQPGSYELQLVVTGQDAKGQVYRGSEEIDFDLL